MALIPSMSKGATFNNEQIMLSNHLENHFHISNKKAMFLNIKSYFERMEKEPYDIIPLTFHIKSYDDPELAKFEEYYMKQSKEEGIKNIWIIKPGEYTNRGNGITVAKDLVEIKNIIKKTESKRTNIVQKYIEKPLLINKRKFDIRCYAMITSINGLLKGYWSSEGYLRTSCKEFNTKNLANKFIHLTNDAVQKNNEEYGKYEAGNKLSYQDLQKYFDINFPDLNIDFNRDINSQIKVYI
jgi:tubulin polyglutamylase TTLL1/tubulin monoglycylase TTLL3/8